MSEQIKAPFTEEQVKALQAWQDDKAVHPFTCGGKDCIRSEKEHQGVLIPTVDGWKCECGEYTQDWAHDFMMDDSLEEIHKPLNFDNEE